MEIEALSFSVNFADFRKTASGILAKILVYPEPFSSSMLASLSEQFSRWGVAEQFGDPEMVNYTRLLLDCMKSIKVQGKDPLDSNFEVLILRKVAAASISQDEGGTDSIFQISPSQDPVANRLAAVKASLMFLRKGGDIEKISLSIPKGEFRDLFVKEVILMQRYLSPVEAANTFLRTTDDVWLDPELANAAIGAGIRNDPEGISKVIADAPMSVARDKAILELVRSIAHGDPDRAKEWLKAIGNPELQNRAAEAIKHPRNIENHNSQPVEDVIIIIDPDK